MRPLTQRSILALLLILTQLGCGSVLRSTKNLFTPEYQDEAGSTHIAVLSVAHWDEYKKALQPTFTIKEKDALDLAAQTTQALEEKFADTLRLAFSVAPPTSGSTETTTRTSSTDADGVTTTTRESERVDEEAPGDVGDVAVEDPSAREASALPAPGSALATELALEPMLKYQAATALYQEVQLLNRYISDAVQRTGYTPYVVRMQVSMMPAARNLAADAYTTLSFFVGRESSEVPSGLPAEAKALLPTIETLQRLDADSRVEPSSQTEYWNACQKLQGQLGAPPASDQKLYVQLSERARQTELPELTERLEKRTGVEGPGTQDIELCRKITRETVGLLRQDQAPYVVPLLVTDNLESTVHGQTLNQVRQLAFGLRLLISGFGAQAGFGRQTEALEQILGRDLNSLLTVARVTDNTYRVRLGAMQQVGAKDRRGGGYAMVPRTHNITFLLLVPTWATVTTVEGPGGIQVMARTDMVRATNGVPFARRANLVTGQRIAKIQKWYTACNHLMKNVVEDQFNELIGYVQTNRVDEFQAAIDRFAGGSTCAEFPIEALWLDLAETLVGNAYASTNFELPERKPRLLPTAQTAVVVDDRKAAALVTLRDGRRLDPTTLSATLDVKWKKTAPPSVPTKKTTGTATPSKAAATCDPGIPTVSTLRLAATRVEVQSNGSNVSLTFPSIDALGLCYDSATLTVTCRDCNGTTVSSSQTYRVHQFLKEAAKTVTKTPRFTARIDTRQLVAQKGAGAVPLFVLRNKDKDKFKVAFSVDGASVRVEPKDSVVAIDEGWEIVGDGTVRLVFENLIPQREITVTTWERIPPKAPATKATKGASGPPIVLTVVEAAGGKS